MMFCYLYKSPSKTLIQIHIHYFLKRSYRIKRIIPNATDSSAFRTSFLQNQCRLSGKSLIRASNYLNFEPSDERPISVLKLLRTYGFPQPSITKIISNTPQILQCNTQRILKPKLDFLISITQSETDVVRMVTTYPNILESSLKSQIIPAFNLLKSVTGRQEDAAAVIKCKPNLLSESISKRLLPNIELLFTLGVPHSQIVKLTTSYGTVLGKKHDDFYKIVMKIKEMGFDLSSSYFLIAVQTLCFVTSSKWESRCELFRSFGFTDDEILSMFKKLPAIMSYSEQKVRGMMEFFVNKLGWSLSRLSANLAVLGYSLEKRTIPRCSVLQVLVSRNSTDVTFMLSTILAMPERKFLKDFVTAHKNDVPEVVDAHQGSWVRPRFPTLYHCGLEAPMWTSNKLNSRGRRLITCAFYKVVKVELGVQQKDHINASICWRLGPYSGILVEACRDSRLMLYKYLVTIFVASGNEILHS